jgi:hypothetical protein
MNWTLLLIGTVMAVVGGFIIWRFRKSSFKDEIAPGCAMVLGILMLGTGLLADVFSFAVD